MKELKVKILSTWVSLESLLNILSKTVKVLFSVTGLDIAFERYVGVVTYPVGHRE